MGPVTEEQRPQAVEGQVSTHQNHCGEVLALAGQAFLFRAFCAALWRFTPETWQRGVKPSLIPASQWCYEESRDDK